ncbi:MAG: GatB/YqeY domain-containing protein [Candidatus Sericytochromatia bacterium]|nr:GatB/YqeY domain-containing protein [Candidatus Sericytochromatia bacterium]
MLKDEIVNSLKESMKNKNERLTMALRNIRAKIIEAEKRDMSKEIQDSDIMTILNKLAKERKQSIEMYQQAGRQDLVDAETAELNIIESYLPKQFSETELVEKAKSLMTENNFTSIKDMGKAIKLFNEIYPGMSDGKILSQIVKNNLT